MTRSHHHIAAEKPAALLMMTRQCERNTTLRVAGNCRLGARDLAPMCFPQPRDEPSHSVPSATTIAVGVAASCYSPRCVLTWETLIILPVFHEADGSTGGLDRLPTAWLTALRPANR